MPDNIKFFKKILIWHFDSRTLDFLRRISTLFLLNDVNLDLKFLRSEQDLANLRTVFDHLAPLLHGINSLSFHQSAIRLVEQYFGNKLAQDKQLSLDLSFDPAANQAANFCMNWLTSEEQDPDEPRFLEVKFFFRFEQFFMALQQKFQSAEHSSTFVIKFHCYGGFDFQLLDLENNIGEQLHGQFDKHGDYWIFRHTADSTRTQLQEWVEEAVEERDTSSRIGFIPMLTIGQIDANAGDNGVNNNVAEEGDQQTSTSKRPKLR